MKNIVKLLVAAVAMMFCKNSGAQDSSRIYFTTGAGVNKIQGTLHSTFSSTVAFNSALEVDLRNNWFAQVELSFNTLKYNQQKKDENSSYLFQNTSSSLVLIGLNGGRDFHFSKSNWFTSLYTGVGYVSIGEPRVSIDEVNNIVTQTDVSKTGVFGKGGGRIGYKTKSKIFQTLYLDGAYWFSSVKTQGASLNGVSIFGGIRMAM
jgi:hypothetical protein